MFYFSHYIYIYVFIEMGANPLLSTTDLSDWTDECPTRGWEQNINQKNPLERMEGDALSVMLPLWSYKSELLMPKPEVYHHLHS